MSEGWCLMHYAHTLTNARARGRARLSNMCNTIQYYEYYTHLHILYVYVVTNRQQLNNITIHEYSNLTGNRIFWFMCWNHPPHQWHNAVRLWYCPKNTKRFMCNMILYATTLQNDCLKHCDVVNMFKVIVTCYYLCFTIEIASKRHFTTIIYVISGLQRTLSSLWTQETLHTFTYHSLKKCKENIKDTS